MGLVKSKARWVQLSEVQGNDASWLTGEGWESDGNGEGGKQVEAWVDGVKGEWTAQHVSLFPCVCADRSDEADADRSGASRSMRGRGTS